MLKKLLLIVGGGFAVAVIAVLGVAATKPDTFSVERKAVMSAPADAIFPNIDDLHRFGTWSPWEKLDPNMHRTYGGAARGVGATYAWSGNKQVGEGKMTILESRPNEQISMRLEFLKPFAATNTTVYTLTPASGGTQVSWSMHGPNTLMGKVMSMFMDMDAMIGKDFEAGLANLKRVSENRSATAAN
jgi:hypothetical protein